MDATYLMYQKQQMKGGWGNKRGCEGVVGGPTESQTINDHGSESCFCHR